MYIYTHVYYIYIYIYIYVYIYIYIYRYINIYMYIYIYIYTPSPRPAGSSGFGDFGHFGHFGDFGHCHGSLHQFYHERDFFGPWSWGGTVGTAGLPQNGPFVCFESICCGAVHLFLCCGSSFPLFCKHLVTSGAVCAAVAVLFWFVL